MELENILNTFLALIFVLALMGLIALLAKRMGLSQNGSMSKNKRLKVVESMSLDSKRRAIILQCDRKQHLVILSHNGETVIDKNLEISRETSNSDTLDSDVKPII